MTASPGAEGQALARGCTELGIQLSSPQIQGLIDYLDLLYRWNASAGLTTVAREDAVRLHLLDSLAAAPFLLAGPCLDLGSGAGLPGLVLAVAKPHLDFELVESNRRRCSFLLEARRLLGLSNLQVLQSDVRSLAGRPYPIVVSRAFRAPREFLEIARKHVTANGIVLVMLADASEHQLRQIASESGYDLRETTRFELPGGGEPRTIASFSPVSRETR